LLHQIPPARDNATKSDIWHHTCTVSHRTCNR